MSASERKRWEEALAKRPVAEARTDSGLPVKLLYTALDLAGWNPDEALGYPGQYPYTRGIYPSMYRGRPWTMRQYAGFGTAEETNARFKWLLEQGQTGLSVALDLPTQMGYDSDDPEVEDEVGRVGVAVDTLADMEVIFDDIPLNRISTSFTINATAAILLAMYLAVAEKQGVPAREVRGTIQNDILKEYVSRGAWIFPVRPSLRLIVDTLEYCMQEAPSFNAISVAGAHFRDAGASAVQEMAFTLADAVAYLEACQARGLAVDDVAPLVSFFFYTHNDFFEEVAKYRAGRRLWARIVRERFGAQKPASWQFRFGCVCGGSTLTAQQPLNNVVRVAYQAMAAVLGGVQSMFTAAYDEAFALPTEESAELALRTQQILAHETGVARSVDPLAGSYLIETLTDRMEAAIVAVMREVEEQGGMVAAVERGWVQAEIARRAYEEQRRIDAGEKVIVGVNRYQKPEEPRLELYAVDPDVTRRQVERLRAVKQSRDDGAVRAALASLRQAALGSDNLMPHLVRAVKAYCTVGEICGVLREVFGEFEEPLVI